jgi:hypothetical protein
MLTMAQSNHDSTNALAIWYNCCNIIPEENNTNEKGAAGDTYGRGKIKFLEGGEMVLCTMYYIKCSRGYGMAW